MSERSERRDRSSGGEADGERARSPLAALQRSLGNRRLLQLRRAAMQARGPDWVRDQLGVTDQDEQNLARREEAEAATAALPGGGRPLDTNTRTWAETAIGGELGDVRLIEGADGACAPIQATAFATPGLSGGNEVYLSSGVDLSSREGQFTLLHELAHVRQQREGRTGDLDGLGGDAGLRDALEAEADAVAHRALSR